MAFFARTAALRLSAVGRPAVVRVPFAARTFSGSARINDIVRKFTEDHEWVSFDTMSRIATVGITKHAAHELGDVVYVELPAVGDSVSATEPFGAVESVKSASDIISPVTGKVTDRNEDLETKPGLINKSPEDEAWIAKVQLPEGGEAEVERLMDEAAYNAFLKN